MQGVPTTLTLAMSVQTATGAVVWRAGQTTTRAILTVPFGVNRILADSVEDAEFRYRADTAVRSVEGLPAFTRQVTVHYRASNGIVAPAFSGVPVDAALTTRLEREDGTLVATATGGRPRFPKVGVGRYVLRLDSAQTARLTLAPTVARTTVDVVGGALVAPVTPYVEHPGTGFNLTMTDVAVVQSVQGSGALVTLVAGREALVRVYVVATALNWGGRRPSRSSSATRVAYSGPS